MAYAFGRRPLADVGARGIEHDPSIIHGNAERGEAVITFDDKSSYRVLVTETSTTRQIKVDGDKKWNKATPELIDSLVNALSYNPFTMKDLTEKQRVEVLLSASPVTITSEEIAAALGAPFTGAPSLEAINELSDQVYEQRRVSNVAADTLKKHAGQLEGALPPDAELGTDWRAGATQLKAEKAALLVEESALIEKLRKAVEKVKADEQKAHDGRMANVQADINAKIAALETERRELIESSVAIREKEIDAARVEANTVLAEKRTELAPKLEQLTTDIATAEERAESQTRAEHTMADAEKARKDAAAHVEKSAALTAAINRLAKLKEEAAGHLAVKGVTIAAPKPGQPVDICREEKGALVPFSRWNEATKDAFCMRIAVLLHGKCGVVFVDEIGHFTEERKKALIESCKKHAENGMQFILGEAIEGDLRVVEG
jgi:hypothetical protein